MLQRQQHSPDGEGRATPSGYPKVFGKYVLLRPMARGGMGELFLAAAGETGGLEKLCVIKTVRPEHSNESLRRRFLDEAKVVVRLNHPNLVQVFDAGRVDDELYLAMELVEGKNLREIWNRCATLSRRVPIDVALFVVRELCRGLDYMHNAMDLDLVHRDITPPNLLVSYHGQVRITDFGTAKHSIKQELTGPGIVYGRHDYFSPEQARGLPVDRRSDIFSAGVVLWELLTGRQLIGSDSHRVRTILTVFKEDGGVPPPSELVSGIPDGLDEVVLKALDADPERRYSEAGEFRSALSDVVSQHFPSCDTDRIAGFVSEIFEPELDAEREDYARFAGEDFSLLRQHENKEGEVSNEPSPPSTDAALTSDSGKYPSGPGGSNNLSPEGVRRDAEARIGRVIAERYRLEELIGIGGMGAVYLCTHLSLGRRYALKVLHEVFGSDPEIVERFSREARAATQTGHPNIIDVVDCGSTESGDLYFVMELLDGRSLGLEILESGPLPIRRAIHIAKQICRALRAAHEVGIIHRDLKSDNVILIDREEQPDFVKVLDFGICKQIDHASSSRTTPGMVIGSPDYMAPEQAAGTAASVLSDVYSLGTILFEMLRASLPFRGKNAIDVLMQKGGQEAPRLGIGDVETIPTSLADLVAACLSRDADRRPKSMGHLLRELERVEVELIESEEQSASESEEKNQMPIPPKSGEVEVQTTETQEHPARSVSAQEESVRAPNSRKAPRSTPSSSAGMPNDSIDGAVFSHEYKKAQPRRWLPVLSGLLIGAVAATAILWQWAPELRRLAGAEKGVSETGVEESIVADSSPLGSQAAGARKAPSNLVAESDSPKDSSKNESVAQLNEGALPAASGSTEASKEGSAVGGPTTGGEELAGRSVKDLLAAADVALGSKRWRGPDPSNLEAILAELRTRDPKNPELERIERAAAKVLRPKARRAFRRKQWEQAAGLYRDLFAVWPEIDGEKADFVKALRREGIALKQQRDNEGALRVADEILVLAPEDFWGLKLRADALAGLKRWGEAVPAYRAALRKNRHSKDTKRGYWRARRMLSRGKK